MSIYKTMPVKLQTNCYNTGIHACKSAEYRRQRDRNIFKSKNLLQQTSTPHKEKEKTQKDILTFFSLGEWAWNLFFLHCHLIA